MNGIYEWLVLVVVGNRSKTTKQIKSSNAFCVCWPFMLPFVYFPFDFSTEIIQIIAACNRRGKDIIKFHRFCTKFYGTFLFIHFLHRKNNLKFSTIVFTKTKRKKKEKSKEHYWPRMQHKLSQTIHLLQFYNWTTFRDSSAILTNFLLLQKRKNLAQKPQKEAE